MQVTQKNLYNLIPPKAAKLTTMLRNERNMALKQALLTFYTSKASILGIHFLYNCGIKHFGNTCVLFLVRDRIIRFSTPYT